MGQTVVTPLKVGTAVFQIAHFKQRRLQSICWPQQNAARSKEHSWSSKPESGDILHNKGPVLIFILALLLSYLRLFFILLFATLIQSPGSKDITHITLFYTLNWCGKPPGYVTLG